MILTAIVECGHDGCTLSISMDDHWSIIEDFLWAVQEVFRSINIVLEGDESMKVIILFDSPPHPSNTGIQPVVISNIDK
jgi:hypothetical protein